MLYVNILWYYLCTIVGSIYMRIIYVPIKIMYLHGPRTFGMWEGTTIENICTHLVPRSRAEFWLSNVNNMKECSEIIEKNIQSWVIVVEYIIFTCLFVWVFTLFSKWWWHKKLVNDFSYIIEKISCNGDRCKHCTIH